MEIKKILKHIFMALHIDATKNMEYDRLTQIIIKKHIKTNSNCIDVGCHTGEVLDLILKYAPDGNHYAFEPIPYLFLDLEKKYKPKVNVFSAALSDANGTTTFQLVKNDPAYSGLKKRRYDIENPNIEEITVEVKRLDDIIPENEKIHFIKIDVEGGEFAVLKGAENILKKNKPTVLFECGLGASDYYGTQPLDIFNFLVTEIGLKLYTLNSYIKNGKCMEANEFEYCFNASKEYYFIAAAE